MYARKKIQDHKNVQTKFGGKKKNIEIKMGFVEKCIDMENDFSKLYKHFKVN